MTAVRNGTMEQDVQASLFSTDTNPCPICPHGPAVHHDGVCGYPACSCGRPVARATDPDTSHQAAEDALPRAQRHRDLALTALRSAGDRGLTDFELADLTGVAQTSIGVRRHELVKLGLVAKTDDRRPAPSGSASIVWRAT